MTNNRWNDVGRYAWCGMECPHGWARQSSAALAVTHPVVLRAIQHLRGDLARPFKAFFALCDCVWFQGDSWRGTDACEKCSPGQATILDKLSF